MDIKSTTFALVGMLFVIPSLYAQSLTAESYLNGKFCNSDAWAQYDGRGNFHYGSNSGSGYGAYRIQGDKIYLKYPGGGVQIARVLTRGNDGSVLSGILEGVVYKKGQCYQSPRSAQMKPRSSSSSSAGYSGYTPVLPSPEGSIGSGSYYSSDPVYIGTPYEY